MFIRRKESSYGFKSLNRACKNTCASSFKQMNQKEFDYPNGVT